MFPEQVHYSRADGNGWKIKDWETANKLLSYLNPEKNIFVIFELSDNSYIQCFGSKTELTVEARVYENQKNYEHWVFAKGELNHKKVKLGKEDNFVEVDSSEVLKMRDARIIIKQFLEERSFTEKYSKHESIYRL